MEITHKKGDAFKLNQRTIADYGKLKESEQRIPPIDIDDPTGELQENFSN